MTDLKIEIAIACHCDNSEGELKKKGLHRSLYLHDINKHVTFELTSENVKFIDPFQGCSNWSDIIEESIDLLWAYNCSIEPFYKWRDTDATTKFEKFLQDKRNLEIITVFKDIFTKGFGLLKPGGKLIFRTDSNTNFDIFIANFKKYIPISSQWIIPTKKTISLQYVIDMNSTFVNDPSILFMVFTKPPLDIFSFKTRNLTVPSKTDIVKDMNEKDNSVKRTTQTRNSKKSSSVNDHTIYSFFDNIHNKGGRRKKRKNTIKLKKK